MLDAAISRACDHLFATQLASGAWEARSDVGPSSTANVLVAFAHLGVLADDERDHGTAWLCRQQRADGSFGAYPFADDGDLSVTAQCWAALTLAVDPEGRAAAARAAAFVGAHGGARAVGALMRTGDVGALYLALRGLLPEPLPAPSLAWSLFDLPVRLLADRVHFGIVMGSIELGLIARQLAGRRGSLLERRIDVRAIELLGLYQNPDGSWNGNTTQTATALLGLFAAGLAPTDARLARAIRWTRSRAVRDADGLWFDVFSTDVWTTAFHLRALLLAGVSRRDPRIVAALAWLCATQLDVPQPWPNQRTRGALRTGGWPFQTGNVTMADTDDTGVVLSVFALARTPGRDGAALATPLADELAHRSTSAIAWLRAMQNDDGGWGAFVHALPARRAPGPLFTTALDVPPDRPLRALRALAVPPPELGDPSTEDLAGRVLHGLASAGLRPGDPMIDRALAFARRMQTASGGWWGRWQTNYLPATAYLVTGAHRAGIATRTPFVDAGLRFLRARQNPDGGWGESPRSYTDPRTAGRGASAAPMTGLVAAALLECGDGRTPELRRAIERLVAEQRPDGAWDNGTYVVTNIPPNNFYTYAGAALHLPLEALARYRDAT